MRASPIVRSFNSEVCQSSRKMNFHSTKNMSLSYKNMNIMRRNQVFCDLNIKVGTKNLYVHKIVLASQCEYFEKMLNGSFKESNFSEIVINDIDPVTFELVIDFMYTSQIKITDCNVQDLLNTSKFLMYDSIYNECKKYIQNHISVQNCLEMKFWTHSVNENELEKFCLSFVLNNYEKLFKSDEFCLMSLSQIEEIVQDTNFKAEEIHKYESIALWVKYDINDRSKYLPALMSHIEKKKIPVSYFHSNMKNEDILKKLCQSFLNELFEMYSAIHQYRGQYNKLIIAISCVGRNQFALEWVSAGDEVIKSERFIWKCKGPSILLDDHKVFVMDLVTDCWFGRIFDGEKKTWRYTSTCMGSKSKIRSLVQLNNCLYLMSENGQFRKYNITNDEWKNLKKFPVYKNSISDNLNNANLLSTVHESVYYVDSCGVFKYLPQQNEWSKISPVRHRIGNTFTTCSLGNCLYIIGMPTNNYKSVVRFDVINQTWSSIPDMQDSRIFASAVFVNKYLYVIGGTGNNTCEVYDHEQEIWFYVKNSLPSVDIRLGTFFASALTSESRLKPENILSYYSGLNTH